MRTQYLALTLAVAASPTLSNSTAIEHVLVSVPIHKKSAETALPVTIMSGEELRREAAATIGETLSNTPGLANASFGPAVGQPVIRGQQGARVTVLQNGTSSADVANTSADHAISVEPLLADSVEILRGPSTLLYGGGAIGGVINVLDNRIPTTALDSTSGGIEYRRDSASDLNNLSGRIETGNGDYAIHASGIYRRWNDLEIPGSAINLENSTDPEAAEETSYDTVSNTDGKTMNFNLGGSRHFDSGFIGLAVSRLENEYGIRPGADGHHEHEDEHGDDHDDEHEDEHGDEHGDEEEGPEQIRLDVEQTRYDAALHLHEPIAGLEVVRGFLTYTDYQHKEIEGNGEVGTRFDNETWEARLEVVHAPIANFHGVIGMQLKENEFSALGEEAFVPATDSTGMGLFLLEDYHTESWTFEAGLRYDYDQRKPDSESASNRNFNSYSASASALWKVASDWNIGLGISSSERAPVTEELYSNFEAETPEQLVVHAATGAIEVGDSNLDQETSRNVDLSLNWQGDAAYMNLTVFYNDFQDYIALANTGDEIDETQVLAYVQDDAVFKGAEIDSEFTLVTLAGGSLALGLGADIVRGKMDQLGDVARLPPMRVRGELNWDNDSLRMYVRGLRAADQDRPGENETDTEGYTRWDAGADYRLGLQDSTDIVLFIQFNNISDEEIRLSTSFLRDFSPEAGRSFKAGVRMTF